MWHIIPYTADIQSNEDVRSSGLLSLLILSAARRAYGRPFVRGRAHSVIWPQKGVPGVPGCVSSVRVLMIARRHRVHRPDVALLVARVVVGDCGWRCLW